MSRYVVSTVLLTAIYALTLASADPWDLLVGATLSGLLVLGFRGFLFTAQAPPLRRPARRALALLPFVWAVAGDVLRGSWYVVLVVLHRRPVERAGLIEVPIGDRTPNGVATTALTTTLSPGSVLIDVDWERGSMLFHVMDARDPDAFRAGQHWFYERYQRQVVA